MRFKQHKSAKFTLPTSVGQQGFTLIEIIVGIVVLSIAFSIFTSLIYPLANQSAKQVHQIKAAELGQSMINEILAKAFDENSDMSGGLYRCGEDSNNDGEVKADDGETCTLTENLGPDIDEKDDDGNDERAKFDDVDDYHNLSVIGSSLGSSDAIEQLYIGYQIKVQVSNDSDYSGDYDANIDNNFTAKLITVTVTTPQGFDFVFAVYRVNF
ncbi:prepilin-type N-terminal cleavage/methylation domain-containing protein [Colwellia sp. C1TZA3]|uniref:type IV pilus modification PilV family protein n=1 Tax=Colwellia sp. C1TZA3 TaxID=2508879 RepID=UPI0011B96428|nr:type II secretion system protein [Colwellia sp. C1TZA3]TWX72710.1 type II secretion system protein [Colwellia sp. C1TZA3]